MQSALQCLTQISQIYCTMGSSNLNHSWENNGINKMGECFSYLMLHPYRSPCSGTTSWMVHLNGPLLMATHALNKGISLGTNQSILTCCMNKNKQLTLALTSYKLMRDFDGAFWVENGQSNKLHCIHICKCKIQSKLASRDLHKHHNKQVQILMFCPGHLIGWISKWIYDWSSQ